MFEFLGDWDEADKKVFIGIAGKRLGGKSFVANPWRLTKSGENVKLDTSRKSVKPVIGTVDVVVGVIQQYYAS